VKFSVIIPARDEEAYIGACLESIRKASAPYPGQVEVIVVLNRCTDRTEEIAREHGARITHDDTPNLATIRNAGAKAANGDIIVTIDADSTMTPNLLAEADRALSSGKVIGGAVLMKLERYSLGILLTAAFLVPFLLLFRISGGCFWCYRRDFEELGGFDERRLMAEDIDFALRLKGYGLQRHKRFRVLLNAAITTSCRKFDTFGGAGTASGGKHSWSWRSSRSALACTVAPPSRRTASVRPGFGA